MNHFKVGVLMLALCVLCRAAPVVVSEEDDDDEGELSDKGHTGLEYDKYLRKVVKTLENDPDMRKKFDDLSLEDLKDGEFVQVLEGVSDKIRARLDDLKRTEIQRLRIVAKKRFQMSNHAMEPKHIEDMVGHVDINNMDQFGNKDFEKLLKKATKDLDRADKERKDEFKRYEMQKELERREKLAKMDEEARKKAQEAYQLKHKVKNDKHLKHPGSKHQLEEVWEQTDHLEKEDFDPKTFFNLHDTNGDQVLDPYELEALFINQVESIYNERDVDSREKEEQISLMREHVMTEIDKNHDKLVSRREFLDAAAMEEFDNDQPWEDLDTEDIYTEDELKTYKTRVGDEMVKLKEQMQQQKRSKDAREQPAGAPVQMNQQQGHQNADQIAQEQAQRIHQEARQRIQQAHQAGAEQAAQPSPQEVVRGLSQRPTGVHAAQQAAAEQVAAQQVAAQQVAAQQVAAQQAATQQAAAQQAAAQQAAAQQAAAQQAAAQQAAAQQAAAQQAGNQQAAQPNAQDATQFNQQAAQLKAQQEAQIRFQQEAQLRAQQQQAVQLTPEQQDAMIKAQQQAAQLQAQQQQAPAQAVQQNIPAGVGQAAQGAGVV